MGRKYETFQHEPLEFAIHSIRVLQILPDLTPNGMIQCQITHTTIDADYTCLSYVWGPSEPSRTILVNGKLFVVRQNLFDFLENVRAVATPTNRSWIDALCIDQANMSERNHQVQQMGLIYSHARCVYIWLGKLPSVRSVKHLVYPPPWRTIRSRDPEHFRRSASRTDIYRNEYWKRAWVRQELLLARHVKVLLRTVVLDFRDFLVAIGYPLQVWGGAFSQNLVEDYAVGPEMVQLSSMLAPFIRLKPQLLEMNPASDRMPGRVHLTQTTLISLLDSLGNTECAVIHDRIFSLLSLCDEGNNFRVNYGVSEKELVYEVLKQCSTTLCICSIHVLADKVLLSKPESTTLTRFGHFVDVEVQNWTTAAIMEDYLVEASHKEFSVSIISPRSEHSQALQVEEHVHQPLGYPTLSGVNADDCSITRGLLQQLQARAIWVSDPEIREESSYIPSLGEPIGVPDHLQEFMSQASRILKHPREEMQLYADGFSFVLENGRARKVRLSLDYILRYVAGEPWARSERTLCHPVRISDCVPHKRLGHGPWNTSSKYFS